MCLCFKKNFCNADGEDESKYLLVNSTTRTTEIKVKEEDGKIKVEATRKTRGIFAFFKK